MNYVVNKECAFYYSVCPVCGEVMKIRPNRAVSSFTYAPEKEGDYQHFEMCSKCAAGIRTTLSLKIKENAEVFSKNVNKLAGEK